jgi:CBS domain-containing protein
MTVGNICNREVDMARPDETVRAAADRMLQRNVGTLIVCDNGRRPVGILTDRDITLKVVAHGSDPETVKVSEIMSTLFGHVTESTDTEPALSIMRAGGFRRLPVVGATGALVGVLSVDDILVQHARETGLIADLIRKEGPGSLQRAPAEQEI